MSRRITFTDFEIEQIVRGLEALRDETSLSYEVIQVGKRFYQELIDKLAPMTLPKSEEDHSE